MTFLAPQALWSLLAIPFLVAGYVAVAMRRRTAAPEALVVRDRHGRRARPRRHLPAVIFLLAIVTLLVAFARPEAEISVPTRSGQVVLAIDTSNSMLAGDVAPSRLAVAQRVARDLVADRPGSVRIGVVAFTDGGLIMQPPTETSADVVAAIDALQPSGGTSIGEGIFASLIALADGQIAAAQESDAVEPGGLDDMGLVRQTDAAVVLISDGEDIDGADPLALAELAAEARLPVHTVGVGTAGGTVLEVDGFNIATALDEQVLVDIAAATGGRYHLATSDLDLSPIFDAIDRSLGTQSERIEITALFSMAAIVLIMIAAALSLRWSGRI